MRHTSVLKIANIFSIILLGILMITPMVVLAQGFDQPVAPPTGGPVEGIFGEDSVMAIIEKIIQLLLAVAALIAVIFLIIGGFRYITAGGNEEAAEKGKKTITNAIIGLIIVILSFVIVRIVFNVIGSGQIS